jgi:hypothetical protein
VAEPLAATNVTAAGILVALVKGVPIVRNENALYWAQA